VKRAALWLWDHWYFVILAIGLGVLVLWSRKLSPAEAMARVKLELEAIRAKTEARQVRETLGTERAREAVEAQYRNELVRLDVAQKARAEELRDDPAALAQFLVRVGGSKPFDHK